MKGGLTLAAYHQGNKRLYMESIHTLEMKDDHEKGHKKSKFPFIRQREIIQSMSHSFAREDKRETKFKS